MTTACALMANIAVMDGLETLLCRHGVLDLMYEVAAREPEDCDFNEVFDRPTYINNVLAAIGNMSFSPTFVKISLRRGGVEILQSLRDEFSGDDTLADLIENPLSKLIYDTSITTTSFHMAARIGSQSEIIARLKKGEHISKIDALDSTNKTVLSYALEENYEFIAHLLLLCGADPNLLDPALINDNNRTTVLNGHRRYKNARTSFTKLISAVGELPVDLSYLVANFSNNYGIQKMFG